MVVMISPFFVFSFFVQWKEMAMCPPSWFMSPAEQPRYINIQQNIRTEDLDVIKASRISLRD